LDHAAATLAGFSSRLDLGTVPAVVVAAAKLRVIDVLGCGLASVGCDEEPAPGRVFAAQGGTPEATVMGSPTRLPAASAAMVNGVAAHALDFDDTHGPSVCHASAVVVPAALALAEAVGATGAEVLAAVIVGTEVVCVIGMATPGEFHARGFHPTSICGAFGAAAAAARILHLDRATTVSALGLVGSFASGLLAYVAEGTRTKPLHAGWAAQAGVQAALLARAGAEGPTSVLDGRDGLYASHTGATPDLGPLLDELGRTWQSLEIALKAYPACHFIHACIDAAAAASERLGMPDAASIERVDVRLPSTGVRMTLDPLESKSQPRTPYDAKFSLPFSVASHLVHGRLDVMSYAPSAIGDERVLALARRFAYREWSVAEAPAPFAGEVRLGLDDGRAEHVRVDHPRGAPANPMSRSDIRSKFAANAGTALDAARAHRFADELERLEEIASVTELLEPLAQARPSSAQRR
jgi:2-methylcitrate dehydratase PrpD